MGRSGTNIAVSMGFEDSYGAGQASPLLFQLRRSALRVSPSRSMVSSPEIRDDPNPTEPTQGPHELTGEVGVVLTANLLGLVLEASFGAGTASTGTSAPYTWTHKLVANALKSLVIEKWDSVNSKSDLIKGVVVNSLRMSFMKGKGEPVVATLGFTGVGAAPARNVGTRFDTPTAFTDAVHSTVASILLVDATSTLAAQIEQLDVSWTWAVTPQNGITGNIFSDGIDRGNCAIEAAIRARRPAADTINALCDNLPHTFQIDNARPGDPTRFMRMLLGECKVERVEGADESDPGPVVETFKVFPYYKSAAGLSSTVWTTANDRANYSAA